MHRARPQPFAFAMRLGIFPLFFVFVWRMRKWQPESGPSHWSDLRRYFPGWVLGVAAALAVYAFVSFFIATNGANRISVSGGVSSLPDVESIRAFSGHWMLFYALPALYFTFVPPEARPREYAPAA